jgi:hypothetical protein
MSENLVPPHKAGIKLLSKRTQSLTTDISDGDREQGTMLGFLLIFSPKISEKLAVLTQNRAKLFLKN